MANLSVLTRAAALSETNPAAADLLIQLDAAYSSSEIVEALEVFDAQHSEN